MIRVLLVEDNESNREMLSRRLARRGYDVALAADGFEAVSQAITLVPDVVLLDVSLPGIDGLEVARRLRAEPGTRAIALIALTAHALGDDRSRCLAAGCDEYETKPVDLTRLMMKIEALAAGSRQ